MILLLSVALVWLPIRYFDKLQKANEELTNIDLPSYGGVVAHSYLPSNWIAALGLFAGLRWTRSWTAGSCSIRLRSLPVAPRH